MVASRLYSIAANTSTGALYGMWRNLIFKATKTTDKSKNIRKYLIDLISFNTFQVPVYATAVGVASLISEGHVDMEKVGHGAAYIAAISPLIGPTMGWYMDKLRKVFGVKSAPEKANANQEGENDRN